MASTYLTIYVRTPHTTQLIIEQIKECHTYYGPRAHVAFADFNDYYPTKKDLEIVLDEIQKVFPNYTIRQRSGWYLCRPK